MRPIYLLRLVLAGLSTIPCIPALCQKDLPAEDIHASLIPGKKKSLVAYSGSNCSFTMDVVAKTAKPSDIPGFVTVEGQIVQSTLVPAQQTAEHHSPGPPRMTPAREQEILTNYMNYELGYYKKKLKQKYTGLQSEWITIKDRLFLIWYFDMPKDYKLVSRQLYFSTLLSGQVLDLNAPVFKMDQYNKARAILLRLAHSLKTYDKPIDLAALGKQMNK